MRDRNDDREIRSALHVKHLRRIKAKPETIVIDELGLAHSKARIDVAVINNCIHGYEIKSAQDTLDRLVTQVDIYRRTLQKLTIVAASKHIAGIMDHAPGWCGILMVKQGARGGITFHALRRAARNPDVVPVMMAHLLWRDEVVGVLSAQGYSPSELRRPRRELYHILCEAMTMREITAAIKNSMVQRKAWRDRAEPV